MPLDAVITIEGCASGLQNMQRDLSLLQQAEQDGRSSFFSLRLYQWSEPTITYGFAQKAQQLFDYERLKQDGIAIVARSTGGRALLHHDELTYALCASINHPVFGGSLLESYQKIASCLCLFLEELNMGKKISVNRERTSGGTSESRERMSGRTSENISENNSVNRERASGNRERTFENRGSNSGNTSENTSVNRERASENRGSNSGNNSVNRERALENRGRTSENISGNNSGNRGSNSGNNSGNGERAFENPSENGERAFGNPSESTFERIGQNSLCYLSTGFMEIELDGKKLIGSAQKRGRFAYLQHGSIPIKKSPYNIAKYLVDKTTNNREPKVAVLSDYLDESFLDFDFLANRLAKTFAKSLAPVQKATVCS